MSATPIVKWAGGKSRLLEQYQPYWPQRFERYFEPFAGGAAAFFWLRQERGPFPAVLGDANAELINLYRVVQKSPHKLIQKLEQMKEQHCQEYYYEVRAQQPKASLERAARLVYLNKTCYNGLYRVNAKGQFNVPLGRYQNPSIVQADKLLAAHQALQDTELVHQSYEKVVAEATAGDLVYFDPPYQPLNVTSNFTSYTKDSFGETEQRALSALFRQLVQRGCQVLLSNSDTPLIRELYSDFGLCPVQAPRFINSKKEGRQAIGELLILGTARAR